jgi:hypothetical protein
LTGARSEHLEDIRPVFVQPLQERPRVVEVDPDTGVVRQSLEEWQILSIARVVDNARQIAERLVAMSRKDEVHEALLKGTEPKLP